MHPVQPARVPPKEVFKEYVGRKFHGTPDFAIFDYAMATKKNVLLEGPTGAAKTMAVTAYAAKNGLMMASIPSNVGIEPSQLFGKHVPEPGGGFKWVDGPVTYVVRHGGVLLWNEINFTPPRVATVMFGLLDRRREIVLLDHEGEIIRAHEDLFIIADMNPGYQGTTEMNAALRNRFSIQLKWDYDAAVEKKLVSSDTLRQAANDIRSRVEQGEFETPVSTNMLIEFEDVARGIGMDIAVMNFVNHFSQDERSPIKLVFDTMRANIENELLPPIEHVEVPDDEIEPGYTRDSTWYDRETGRTWRIGDVDPDWGVFGVNWVEDNDKDDASDDGK
jgi:MoxR-like ATPase